MLARLDPGSARSPLLPARRPDQGCRAPARARLRPARGRQAREPGPLLRGRPRRDEPSCADTAVRACAGPARSWTATAACSGVHEGQHEFTVGQRRGLNVSSTDPLYVLSKDARTGDGHGRSARGARRHHGAPREHHAAPPGAHHPDRSDALPRQAAALPGARNRRPGTLELELDEPAFAVAPGQLGCLMHDDCVVGEGTIGEPA